MSRTNAFCRRLGTYFASALLLGPVSVASAIDAPVFHLDFSSFQDLSTNKMKIEVGDAVTLVNDGGPKLGNGVQLDSARWEGIEDSSNSITIFDHPILDGVATKAGSIVAWIKPEDGDEWNNIAKTPCEENVEPCDEFNEFRGIEFQASKHAGVFGAVQGWHTNNFGPNSPFNGGEGSETPSGEWTHVALVWNAAGDHTAWVNGEAGATIFGVGDEDFGLNTPGNWTIGGDGLAAERYLRGELADFAIYDSALNDTDLQQIMQNGVGSAVVGDFNGDGALDIRDVDALSAAISSGLNNKTYDVTSDGKVNSDDLQHWVKDLKKTWIGDADMNGEFGSADFVGVFITGKYEVDVPAAWSEGDWDGDGRFSSADFVAAFVDGGYEAGPRAATNVVPEPATFAMLFVAVIALFRRRR